MKHKLLSLMALTGALFMSSSVWAQTELPDPVPPTKPAYPEVQANWVTPVAGGTYYIYNVGAGQFLGCGLDWGTRAVTTTENLRKVGDAAWDCAANKNAIIPFQLETAGEVDYEGTWVYISHIGTNKANSGAKYLAHEGNAGWVDADEGRRNKDKNGYWRIEPTEDGFILRPHDLITVVDEGGTPILDGSGQEQYVLTEKAFGLHATNMGEKASLTWTDRADDATSFVHWKFIDASTPEDVEAILNNEDAKAKYKELTEQFEIELAIYNAKVALKATIAKAKENDIEDVNVAIEVYNNPDATLAQLKKQDSHLNAEIAGLAYDIDAFKVASEDNPQDVTEYVLKNPTFDTNNDGWTGTGLTLKHQTRTDGVFDAEKNYVAITAFIEAWSGGALEDGSISQTIYGLPAGKYVLECDAMATRQGGLNGLSDEEAVEGAYIFITGEDSEVTTPIKAPNAQPKHWSVVFISTGSDWLTFGLKTENTTANWISADNFKVTFYGETTKTQAQLELDALIKEAEPLVELFDTKKYQETIKEDLDGAIQDARGYLDGSDEECASAMSNLKEKMDAVNASIKAYELLLTYLSVDQGGQGLLDYYYNIADNCDMDELATKFDTWKDEWQEAYEEGTYSTDQIMEYTSSILPSLKAAISPQTIKPGTDLTWLMTNPGFDTSLDGWTVVSGATPTISSGLAEVYQAAFDITQVIEDLPVGVYEIALQGFTRNQPNGNRMAFTEEDQEGTTFAIYTPTNDAKIQSILAGASTSLIAQRGEETEPDKYILVDGGDYDIAAEIDGVVYYMPNGMASARKHFDAGHYKTSVKVVNQTTGDLTFGIRCTKAQEWCLWDAITITYLGEDDEEYKKIIDNKLGELNATHDYVDSEGNPIYITAEGEKRYTAISEEASDVKENLGGEDASTQMAIILAKIDAVIDYLKEGDKLVKELNYDLADYVETRITSINTPDEGGFSDYANEQKAASEESGQIESNEAVAGIYQNLSELWGGFVSTYAEENAYDDDDRSNYGNASFAINNPWFLGYRGEGMTSRGWTLELPDSLVGKRNIGLGENVAEMYNTSKFKISQTLRGLKAGWYQVTVDGFYRPGAAKDIKTAEDAQVSNVTFFATTSVNEYAKALKNIMVGAQPESFTTDEATVTIGDNKYFVPNMMVSAAAYLIIDNGDTPFAYLDELEIPAISNSIYKNYLDVEVGEDGVLTIGLNKEENYLPLDWTIFQNWSLTYFGDAMPDAIKSAEAKSAAKAISTIYTLDGRQANSLQRGINIVRTADGNVQKVLVK